VRPGAPILITGGAGFIGTNLADRLLGAGWPVILYDNLSREGVSRNLAWLRQRHGERLEAEIADVRDAPRLRAAVARAGHVVHLAAQVAVTTSLSDPVADFEVNARGTLNVLEAIRRVPEPPSLLYTSTNKVYGALADLRLHVREGRFVPEDTAQSRTGIDERRPLDLYSPYGCSKGCADQYVLDYARIYGLRAVVFRMSCIYGPHQCGNEDQGWVAHFLLRALAGRPITIYGNGMQVRDALHVDDLIDAMERVRERLSAAPAGVTGQAFNVGGGPANAVSLLELVQRIAARLGHSPELEFAPWRPGDQRYYVTDVTKLAAATGWGARVSVEEGVHRLVDAWAARPETGTPAFAAALLAAGQGGAP
jgi:CDP-paratose 2-epimerase